MPWLWTGIGQQSEGMSCGTDDAQVLGLEEIQVLQERFIGQGVSGIGEDRLVGDMRFKT